MDTPTKVALSGAAITAVLIPLVSGIAIWGMRRSRAARGQSAEPPIDPQAVWVLIGLSGLLGGFAILAVSMPLVPGVPPILLVLAVALVPSLVVVAYRRLGWFGLVERVSRRANRGDLAGAIADLQAALDRQAGRNVPPTVATSTAPFDPWAPPRDGPTRNPRGAVRFNLMGILQARRGDWAAALGWFERADRVGNGEPIYRLNRGEALVMLGRAEEGLPLARAAIAAVPPIDPSKEVSLLLSLARTLADVASWDEARRILDQADATVRAATLFRSSVRTSLAREIAAVRDRLPAGLVDPVPR